MSCRVYLKFLASDPGAQMTFLPSIAAKVAVHDALFTS